MSLAVIIPAFKVTYIEQTLCSLTRQSNKNFNVYVGDDFSSDEIYSIVQKFESTLKITYKKFDSNLGKTDLAGHWRRCISMIKEEKWIWILPDDDIIESNCISTFFENISAAESLFHLYRFQTSHINESGSLLLDTSICPTIESSTDFILNKLKFLRSSSLAEYIFSRESYMKYGGFTSLPLAWGSDDLLWAHLSRDTGIFTLNSGRVYLRQSKENISSMKDNTTVNEKVKAKYIYLETILSSEVILSTLLNYIDNNNLRKIISDHLFFEYRSYNIQFSLLSIFNYAFKNDRLIGGGILKNIYRILRYNYLNAKYQNVRYSSNHIIL